MIQSDNQSPKKKSSSNHHHHQKNLHKPSSSSTSKQILTKAQDLYQALKHDKKKFKSVQTQHPSNKNYTIIDFSLYARGYQQDQIYLNQPYYRNNIRRGNTLLYNKITQQIQIARKGLIKFFDLTPTILQAIKSNHTNNISNKKDKSIYQCIFKQIQNVLSHNKNLQPINQAQIQIYKVNKANGQNVQLSFNSTLNQWMISSKNVCIFLKNINDIDKYTQMRYSFATMIAKPWFTIIDKLTKQSLSALKKQLTGKTMIGEYCGNPDHQHLVKYNQTTIFFYAIVQAQSPHSCIPPKQAFAFFQKFHIPIVHNYQKSYVGAVNCLQKLGEAVLQISKSIARASITQQQQGSVIYFVIKQPKKYIEYIKQNNLQQSITIPTNNQNIQIIQYVSSLGKLKTMQYRILRKLRQKLKHFFSTKPQDDPTSKSQKKYGQFEKQTYKLIQGQQLNKPLQYYFIVALLAFQYLNKYIKFNQATLIIKQHYLDFLNIIFWCIQHKKPITSQLTYDKQFILNLRTQNWDSYSTQISKQYPSILERLFPKYAKIKKFTQISTKQQEIQAQQINQDIQ